MAQHFSSTMSKTTRFMHCSAKCIRLCEYPGAGVCGTSREVFRSRGLLQILQPRDDESGGGKWTQRRQALKKIIGMVVSSLSLCLSICLGVFASSCLVESFYINGRSWQLHDFLIGNPTPEVYHTMAFRVSHGPLIGLFTDTARWPWLVSSNRQPAYARSSSRR